MPENLEIKLRALNTAKLEHVAKHIGKLVFSGQQTDTYFCVHAGRLKLRETRDRAELIYYNRPDTAAPKRSQYLTFKITTPRKLKIFLREHYGIKHIVRKNRRVYIYRNARIHLDTVAGLGKFFELEIPISRGVTQAQRLMRFLLRRFGLENQRPIRDSYSDMLLNSQK